MYERPARNSDGVRWRDVRARSDFAFAEMHDEFCACYYDYWRYNASHPWGPFDALETKEQNAEQFRLMQIMLHNMGVIMFHKINHRMNQLGEPGVVPQDDYRYLYIRDENGNVIETVDLAQNAKADLAATMQALGTVSAKQMMDHYRRRIADLNGPEYEFPDWDLP